MQTGGLRANRDAIIKYAAAALIVYGAVGVAVHLRFISLLVEGVRGWLGLQSAFDAPLSMPWLDALTTHYSARPWLPWAAWLVAIGLLAWARRHTLVDTASPIDLTVGAEKSPIWVAANARWLTLGVLLVLLLVGGYARMNQLLPQSVGISQKPYDDEGVYAGASQLFLQGILPYRDYFFAHPPIAAISYAPALLYHFNEWGSPTSFITARYLSVAYSLITLVFLFFTGKRLAGLWGGAIVGLLWALDGRVVDINRKVMLDGPMVLLSCAALFLYLRVRSSKLKTQSSKPEQSEIRNYAFVGAVAALSALTKIAGMACLLAIVADIVWVGLEHRKRINGEESALPMRHRLFGLLGGAAITGILVLGPFLLLSPSQFVRQVFFFQLLRPGDGLTDVIARIADLSATLANSLTILSAALGFVALSIWIWRSNTAAPDPADPQSTIRMNAKQNPQSAIDRWRVVALWTFFSLLLFTYSRSFYGHYYIQLAAPLCLLGAGISLIPGLLRGALRNTRFTTLRVARYAPLALLVIITLPLAATEWSGVTSLLENRKFELVGRYINDAVQPGTAVLTTDEQFNFLAARPPSRNATGYLVDSYGHLIYLGLGLNNRDWGDLWSDVFGGKRSNDVYSALWKPAAQADLLDRASNSPLIVIHDTGEARFTAATLAAIRAQVKVVEQQKAYTIYRKP